MEDSYYYQRLKEIEHLTHLSFEKKAQFFQHALLVSSGVLGILVSLRANSSDALHIRLVFLLTVLLLGLGILTCSIVVHSYSVLIERARQVYIDEVQKALQEDRKVQPCFSKQTKTEKRLEKITKGVLFLAMLSLISYSVLVCI